MVIASYEQRAAMQWSVVAMTALLAIASFLAAFYHRQSHVIILPCDTGRSLRTQTNQANNTLRCNGLANLCDIPANEIVYATLHNADSAVEDGSVVAHNHVLELERAVKAGYRGINLDIGKCFGQVRFVHSTCLISSRVITTVLQHLVEFLDENPHEVIIVPVQLSDQLLGSELVTLAEIDEAFKSVPGWKEKLYDHPDSSQPWPTLRELIEANTRILFFHYNGESCTKGVDCPVGFHPWFKYAAETQFSFNTVDELRDTDYACEITRGGSSTRDFFGVNIFVTPPRKVAALRVNRASFLKSHVAACTQLNSGLRANLILVNYWGIGDLLDVVHELNAAL